MITEQNGCFHLRGKSTSYLLSVDEAGRLYHLYYGRRLSQDQRYEMHRNTRRGWSAQDINCNPGAELPNNDVGWLPKDCDGASLDEAMQEYPSYGRLDLRSPAYQAMLPEGNCITDLRYQSYRIVKGKPALAGLPHSYDEDGSAQTLCIRLADPLAGLEAELLYTVFEGQDVLCRSARLMNTGSRPLILKRALSANMDFCNQPFDLIFLSGAWGRECHVSREPVAPGIRELSCARGGSGHQINPFAMLCEPSATENHGDCYGFSLVYSGNYTTVIEQDQYGITRVQMGINPFTFSWKLEPGDSFQTPECILAYSAGGIGAVSRIYHDFFRNNLIRGEWKHKERPILLNSWEAAYFDFDEEKLLRIARQAQALGIELFVMDDGWYGKRNNDHSSLGDWFPNLDKLPGGLEGLGEKICALGMRFGLWMEPEMISPDSELYRAHPDWAVQVPGRTPAITRWQYVLDLTNPAVRRHMVDSVSRVLDCPYVTYIKWDMNRHLTDMPSMDYAHRYMLGLYEVLEEIVSRYPHVLFESCSGGGGRADPGILYYMPQTWISDDSDAMERLLIQEGTSYAYPLGTMSAHVTAVPNHQTGRITPLCSRGDVSQFGVLGYELDVTLEDEASRNEIRRQVALHKKLRGLISNGDFYRLISPFQNNNCLWQVVAKDGSETIFLYARVRSMPNPNATVVRLTGLEPESLYQDMETGREYRGDELMYYGVNLQTPAMDYATVFKRYKRISR